MEFSRVRCALRFTIGHAVTGGRCPKHHSIESIYSILFTNRAMQQAKERLISPVLIHSDRVALEQIMQGLARTRERP